MIRTPAREMVMPAPYEDMKLFYVDGAFYASIKSVADRLIKISKAAIKRHKAAGRLQETMLMVAGLTPRSNPVIPMQAAIDIFEAEGHLEFSRAMNDFCREQKEKEEGRREVEINRLSEDPNSGSLEQKLAHRISVLEGIIDEQQKKEHESRHNKDGQAFNVLAESLKRIEEKLAALEAAKEDDEHEGLLLARRSFYKSINHSFGRLSHGWTKKQRSALFEMVNHSLKEAIGKPRESWTIEDFRFAAKKIKDGWEIDVTIPE